MAQTEEREKVVDVLIVDDDVDLRGCLADMLTEWGYAVECAGNGAEALSRWNTGMRPRTILLDLQMPVLDGWEFLQRREHDERLSAVPVVLLTAEKEHPIGPGALSARLSKPFSAQKVLEALRGALTSGLSLRAQGAA